MKKTKKLIPILLLLSILLSNFSPILAKSIYESDKVNLYFDHDCVSVLRIKGTNMLKQVAYVCYKDPDTGIKYPAFCVEPSKEGIGTGAGDSYDVTLSQLSNPILWRMLYKGYVGSSYTSWGLECDDDLYFATKTAVHCFADGSTPTSKYEVAHRVASSDNATFEEVQRRGAKVLQVAQAIYDYAYSSSDNYIKATVSVSKGVQTELTLNGSKYLAQTYSATGNKELTSYNISILGFPAGTRILNSSNNDSSTMTNSTFKIAIPVKSITENFTGYINISDAKVKTFPIFYANSGDDSTQNYVITDPSEIVSSRATLKIDAYKSTLKIVKTDSETNKPIANVVFNVKYADGTNIGDYTTDINGTITISKLKQGNIIVTEKSTPSNYILNSSSKNITLEYNSSSTLSVTNDRKKGNVKVIKFDKDNNEIRLSSVEFKLYNENKKEIGTYTTDKNGEIFIDNLDIGKYTIKETKTNAAYELTKDVTFVVDYNKTTTLKIDNEKSKGQLQVIKIDADYNNIPIEGVSFNVLDSNKNIIETIKTNEQGMATTSRLPSYDKTYYLQEIETNKNYVLDKTLHEFTIVKDEVSSLVIENMHQKGNLQIYKVDKDDHKITLGGITFKLYSEEFDKFIGTYTTDLNGEIKIDNLRTGNYILKEITKKNGYKLAEDMKIEIKANETNKTIVENELEKGKIKVIKIDKDDNTIYIPDTKFEILDENKKYIETIVTNENGEAFSSNLPSYNRFYYVHEIEANKSYQVTDTEFKIGLTVDKTTELKIENEVKKGKIQIEKVDKDNPNIKIEGVVFNIINERTHKVVDTITTDKNGIATTIALNMFDTYTAIEIKTNKKYELNTEDFKNIKVPENDIVKVRITNEKKKGKIKVIKVDADNHEVLLENVKFEILDKDMKYVETLITNKKGEATSSLLPSVDEKYYLKEVETNELYELSTELQTITLNENQILNIIFENYSKTGNLEIVKVDKDNNKLPVEGATFEIIDETTNKVIQKITTDFNGKALFKNLKVTRRYTIHEISTNKKYNLNLDDITGISIKANDTTSITIENEKKKGQIKIIKVDKDNNDIKLEGIKFEILDSNMNVIENLTTDKNGEAISSNLPCIDETYFIREVETLNTYVLNTELKTIVLTEDEITNIKFENERIKGKVEITKVDSKDENKKLEGAQFGLYDENNNLIETLVTDKDGIAISQDLYKGKYYLKELETGSNYYLLNEDTFEFEIVNNEETIKKTIENEPTDITVDVDKIGTIEIKPGEDVNYEFSNIANNSNVYLDNFKWFDYIPTDYIQLQKMTTGTWNQELIYKVYYKTNKTDDYVLFKENLKTTENYDLDFTTIEFADDEYIVEIMFDFGKVDIGFKEDTKPTMNCKSFDTLKENDTFTNHTKTIGTYFEVTAEADSKWTTITHVPEKPHEPVLPRTGK